VDTIEVRRLWLDEAMLWMVDEDIESRSTDVAISKNLANFIEPVLLEAYYYVALFFIVRDYDVLLRTLS
jgi:hypothetical protein